MNVLLESELTETASEGEGEYVETGRENFVSRSIQCNSEIPCERRFSVSVLRNLYETANDPRTANDPGPQMIPKLDRK